ncbi:MAG: hypothetical protein ABSC03_18325 [Verrucomicrobiota bacterium]|jgi:hypothetical protein
MSESVMAVSGGISSAVGAHYVLKSDIAQFCLPAANRDSNRKFAYANSICFAFLVVGAIGIVKVPQVVLRPLPDLAEAVPIEEFIQQPEQTPQTTDAQPDQPTDNAQADAVVTPVVVAAASADVAFPVPVEGATVLATTAKYAPPPPAVLKVAPRPVAKPQVDKFVRGQDRGTFPPPPFSIVQGILSTGDVVSVTLLVEVSEEGVPEKADVDKTCGKMEIDRKTAQWIKSRWHWEPNGGRRLKSVEIEYRMQ